MRDRKSLFSRIFVLTYFFILFFAVFGVRLLPIFNFRVAHGYNFNVFKHLSDVKRSTYDLNIFSRYDWWVNITLFLFFPFAFRVLIPASRVYKIFIVGIFLSISIELFQYLFDLGLADINDVIANSIGSFVGCVIIGLIDFIKKAQSDF